MGSVEIRFSNSIEVARIKSSLIYKELNVIYAILHQNTSIVYLLYNINISYNETYINCPCG